MICKAWEGTPFNIVNHSTWRRIKKDLPECSVMGWSMLAFLEQQHLEQFFVQHL
jgi:hypothetical protein